MRMLTAAIVCLALSACGGTQVKTVIETKHLTCPAELPPVQCDLGACPDAHSIETVEDLQEAYLKCAASAVCLSEHVGTIKRLHQECEK